MEVAFVPILRNDSLNSTKGVILSVAKNLNFPASEISDSSFRFATFRMTILEFSQSVPNFPIWLVFIPIPLQQYSPFCCYVPYKKKPAINGEKNHIS